MLLQWSGGTRDLFAKDVLANATYVASFISLATGFFVRLSELCIYDLLNAELYVVVVIVKSPPLAGESALKDTISKISV